MHNPFSFLPRVENQEPKVRPQAAAKPASTAAKKNCKQDDLVLEPENLKLPNEPKEDESAKVTIEVSKSAAFMNVFSSEQLNDINDMYRLLAKDGILSKKRLEEILAITGSAMESADLENLFDDFTKGTEWADSEFMDLNCLNRKLSDKVLKDKDSELFTKVEMEEAFLKLRFEDNETDTVTSEELLTMMTNLGEKTTQQEVEELFLQVGCTNGRITIEQIENAFLGHKFTLCSPSSKDDPSTANTSEVSTPVSKDDASRKMMREVLTPVDKDDVSGKIIIEVS